MVYIIMSSVCNISSEAIVWKRKLDFFLSIYQIIYYICLLNWHITSVSGTKQGLNTLIICSYMWKELMYHLITVMWLFFCPWLGVLLLDTISWKDWSIDFSFFIWKYATQSQKYYHSHVPHVILKSQIVQHRCQIYCFTVVVIPLLLFKFVAMYVYPLKATEKSRIKGGAPASPNYWTNLTIICSKTHATHTYFDVLSLLLK